MEIIEDTAEKILECLKKGEIASRMSVRVLESVYPTRANIRFIEGVIEKNLPVSCIWTELGYFVTCVPHMGRCILTYDIEMERSKDIIIMSTLTYKTKRTCNNCRNVVTWEIPVGTSVQAFLEEQKPKCHKCGCDTRF